MTKRSLLAASLMTGLLLTGGTRALAESTPLTKVPANLEEIKALQKKVQEVTKRVIPAVVGVQVGMAWGSGVIVSEDGYVLTAGHVSGKPGQDVQIYLADGKVVKGKTLGNDRTVDSGMIKIIDDGSYPYVPMGDSTKLEKGQWCVSLGHPGGYNRKRTPVLRLGRVIDNKSSLIQTDCTLVGGDSGGPLFDLDGNVIGIHSRIGGLISFNIHVPVSTFSDNWESLVYYDRKPIKLALAFEKVGDRMKVLKVEKDSPEEKAGLMPKDYFAKLDGHDISTQDDIDAILKKKKAGDEVDVEVIRGAERLTLKLTLSTAKN